MARPHIEPFVDRDVPFKKMTLPGFAKGMQYKMLSLDTDTGACSMTVMFENGFSQPPGMSYTDMELFIMSGYLESDEKRYTPGTYFWVPPGVSLPALRAPRGCVALMFYNYAEPSFVESDEDHQLAEREHLTIVNAYENMAWTGTNIFPATATGCLVKILRFDQRTQAFTFLYCMTPNFSQDNISYHDCAEEAYHIWGTSWMMQFGNLPTGGYFYRPPYINHGAFACKLGTLALGRTDSQLYNHFHFNPWTTPEENRERAANRILSWKPELYRWIEQHGHNHPHVPHDFEFPNEGDPHAIAHASGVPHDHGDGHDHHHHEEKPKRRKKKVSRKK